MDALDHRLPTFVRPPSTPVAEATWRSRSLSERITRGAGITSAVVVDGVFGTVWSTREYLAGHKQLAALLAQDASLRDGAEGAAPAGIAPTAWTTALKNRQALLLRNRYDRHQQQVRRGLHGAAAGTGGIAYGVGWCMQPTVLGLGHFAGYPVAVTAASTALLWVGAPLLSVAAGGVAAHEGVRLYRHRQVRKLFPKVCKNPVVGHEEEVHTLLTRRAHQVRLHGGIKIASMVGLAAGAPLLVVGFAPGAAVLTPAGLGAGWASYYLHTRLTFTPQLDPLELLTLRRRDVMNRIVLANSEHAQLKALKEAKRAFYPRGGQGPLGPVARAAGSACRKLRRPAEQEPAQATVARYLWAQAVAEEQFITAQLQLHAHAARKAADDPQHVQELARLDALLAAARARLRAEALPPAPDADQRVPLPAGTHADSLRRADAALAVDAPSVAVAFARHVARHQLAQAWLETLRKDPARAALEDHGVLLSQDGTTRLDLEQLCALCAPASPLDPEARMALAEQVAAAAERFLLTRHKQDVRYLRDQLLDFLAFRLDASRRDGYPQAVPAPSPVPVEA